ncbi:MAG: hypothetical protein COA84_04010 [Robiginitomaculum sp.]|nr:MAG: hypothetical protein COA84_04010 [Robiginitomaculum sp.]
MSQETFEQMSRIYGGVFKRWPEDVREEAEAFQVQHPKDAIRILGAENWLDKALDHAPRQRPSHHLGEQILHTFQTTDIQKNAPGYRLRTQAFIEALLPAQNTQLAWGVALALIMVFGFIGGYSGRTYTLDGPSVAEIMSPAFGVQNENFFAEDA